MSNKPCPFCGSDYYGCFGLPGDFWIECDGDDCCDFWYSSETKEEAITAWNRRSQQIPKDEYVDPFENYTGGDPFFQEKENPPDDDE